MKSQSTKREKENKEYLKLCREVDRDHTDQMDNIICFFCNQAICDVDDQDVKWKVDHHHILRREKFFLVKKYLVPSHVKCHRLDYHVVEDTDAMYDRPWFAKLLFHMEDGNVPKYNDYIREYVKRKGHNPFYRGRILTLLDSDTGDFDKD